MAFLYVQIEDSNRFDKYALPRGAATIPPLEQVTLPIDIEIGDYIHIRELPKNPYVTGYSNSTDDLRWRVGRGSYEAKQAFTFTESNLDDLEFLLDSVKFNYTNFNINHTPSNFSVGASKSGNEGSITATTLFGARLSNINGSFNDPSNPSWRSWFYYLPEIAFHSHEATSKAYVDNRMIVSTTEPISGSVGQQWFNPSTGELKIYTE